MDVFEDRVRNWLLAPAEHLLSFPHGDIAATALLMGYFEGIEIYRTGQDSRNRSADFFANGLARVFDIVDEGIDIWPEVANSLYVQARCGFAHDGMFRTRVFFSRTHQRPILITWPRRNGFFVKDADVESIVINPPLFHNSIVKHLERYLTALRADNDPDMRRSFEAAIEIKWGLNDTAPVIGMTEHEFGLR